MSSLLRSLFLALGLVWGVAPQLNSFPGYDGGVGIFADMRLALSVLTTGPRLIWPAGVVCVGCLRVSWSVLGVIRSAEVLLLHRLPNVQISTHYTVQIL